jgi:hypothetical protein
VEVSPFRTARILVILGSVRHVGWVECVMSRSRFATRYACGNVFRPVDVILFWRHRLSASRYWGLFLALTLSGCDKPPMESLLIVRSVTGPLCPIYWDRIVSLRTYCRSHQGGGFRPFNGLVVGQNRAVLGIEVDDAPSIAETG